MKEEAEDKEEKEYLHPNDPFWILLYEFCRNCVASGVGFFWYQQSKLLTNNPFL